MGGVDDPWGSSAMELSGGGVVSGGAVQVAVVYKWRWSKLKVAVELAECGGLSGGGAAVEWSARGSMTCGSSAMARYLCADNAPYL